MPLPTYPVPTSSAAAPQGFNYLPNATRNLQTGLTNQQNQTDQERDAAMQNLYAAYAGPQRAQQREQDYQTQLNSSLADLGSQYQTGARQSGLQMAKRGRLGSSGDLEAQGNLRYNYQRGAQNAVNQGYQSLLGAQRADLGQYSSLMNALAAGSPQQAAQYTQQGQNLENQFNASQGLLNFQQTNNAIGRQQQNSNSLALGYGLAGAGNALRAYS